MDVVIPNHNLRTFASSITTLGKIGNYLYIEFDPLLGLTLRTLNDAKSAFAEFHFEVGFFERCTCPPPPVNNMNSGTTLSGSRHNKINTKKDRRNRNRKTSAGSRGSGRRKDPDDNSGDDSVEMGVREKRKRKTRRRMESTDRQRTDGESNDRMTRGGNDGGDDHNNEDDLEEKFMCRVPIRTISTVLRPRKGVKSLRIKSIGTIALPPDSNTSTPGDCIGGRSQLRRRRTSQTQSSADINDDNNDSYEDEVEDQLEPVMQLSFEFQITDNGIMRIIHKVGVTDAQGVVAVSPKNGCSEIVALPKILLKMLEPLKQTNEVALTVNDEDKIVTATSFHHSDAVGGGNGGSGGSENMVLAALAAGVMKTETSIGCDEFDEFHYFADGLGEDDEDGETGIVIPDDVDRQVTLVFSIKESKALLQFCSQSNIDEELRAIVSFHWGGRPITIETEGDAFHSQLILATVDHKLLKGSNLGVKRQHQTRQT